MKCVFYCDIKFSNVFFDVDFNFYFGDFGLVCLVDYCCKEKMIMVVGILGYMVLEMLYMGKVLKEIDVYVFGVLVLEVVIGRKFLWMQDEEGFEMLVDSVW